MLRAVAICAVLAIAGCTESESADDAYSRGFNDGIYDGYAQACSQLQRADRGLYEAARQKRVCTNW